jgi:hypothetical protein
MRNTTRLVAVSESLCIVTLLLSSMLFTVPAAAQGSQGQNAVFNSSANCSQCSGSSAFFDASEFTSSGRDFCAVLNYLLVHVVRPTYPSGAVIDARGLPGTTGTSMTCSASPWNGISSPPPSTILLPPGNIVIPSTWYLPSNTHLIGEGDAYSTGGTVGTTIQPTSAFESAGGPFIQFRSSSFCSTSCTGISVEF